MLLSTVNAALVADATDTPVWGLFGATIALATVTAVLVWAACKALGQLNEAKSDRHVEVFIAMGERWASREMTEALVLARTIYYTPALLAALFAKESHDGPPKGAEAEWRREVEHRIILTRIPNYFDEAEMMLRAGSLDAESFDEYFAEAATWEWELWRGTIDALQATSPHTFEGFSTLAQRGLALRNA